MIGTFFFNSLNCNLISASFLSFRREHLYYISSSEIGGLSRRGTARTKERPFGEREFFVHVNFIFGDQSRQ